MGTPDPLLDATRALVERIAGPGRVRPDAGPDTHLVQDCWLDSVELLEILIACESEFGVVFEPARDFADGSPSTLGTLTSLIRSKTTGRSDG